MSITEILQKRDITELLHFTTHKGVTGILATGNLKARNLLSEDKYLEHIYQYNCPTRERDKEWWGYVNLSISSVNRHLFGISSGKWHTEADGWWCILSISPEICTHEGVFFTTTNNMYSGVKRKKGQEGLEALFANRIVQWASKTICRPSSLGNCNPTCEQAEILYPEQIPLKFLQRVYVAKIDDAAKFDSIKILFSDWKHIPCEVRDDLFS